MKIICIGRNYAKHAKEMNSEAPTEPIFFLKPDTALLKDPVFYYPDFTKDLHYECEIVVRINRVGKHIEEQFAHKYYNQIGLGIDFTARDIQKAAKEKGLPWEKAKAFDNSAVLSPKWIDKANLDMGSITFSLQKNEEVVQSGNSQDMLFTIDRLIAYISQFITLKVGDLIYTGTPEGVGPIQIGDKLSGFIGEEKMFQLSVK